VRRWSGLKSGGPKLVVCDQTITRALCIIHKEQRDWWKRLNTRTTTQTFWSHSINTNENNHSHVVTVFVIAGVCVFENSVSISCDGGSESVAWYTWEWSSREWSCVQRFETSHSVLWSYPECSLYSIRFYISLLRLTSPNDNMLMECYLHRLPVYQYWMLHVVSCHYLQPVCPCTAVSYGVIRRLDN